MKLSRTRVTLFAVLGVSVAGLALDKVALGPGSAGAAVSDGAAGDSAGADAAAMREVMNTARNVSAAVEARNAVTRRMMAAAEGWELEGLGGDRDRPAVSMIGNDGGMLAGALDALGERIGLDSVRRDELASLFMEPESWRVLSDEDLMEPGEQTAVAVEGLELTSVFSGRSPMAIINGRSVVVGDRVAGYRVTRIGSGGVVLSHPTRDDEVWLHIRRAR